MKLRWHSFNRTTQLVAKWAVIHGKPIECKLIGTRVIPNYVVIVVRVKP